MHRKSSNRELKKKGKVSDEGKSCGLRKILRLVQIRADAFPKRMIFGLKSSGGRMQRLLSASWRASNCVNSVKLRQFAIRSSALPEMGSINRRPRVIGVVGVRVTMSAGFHPRETGRDRSCETKELYSSEAWRKRALETSTK